MTRQAHAKLHFYLNRQRALLERSNNGNAENCWNNLIVPMTTAWLETTSAKVQNYGKLVNQQPSFRNEEGSETMYCTSLVDDDIVQTTTKKFGLGN